MASTGSYDPREYIVLRDPDLIYLNNAKVACSSIKISLGLKSGAYQSVPEERKLDTGMLDIKTTLSEDERSFFKFTFVRNPFQRIASCYCDKIANPDKNTPGNFLYENYFFFFKPFLLLRPDMTFAQFVRRVAKIPDAMADRHFKSQYSIIYDRGDCLVDYVGRMENLSSDFDFLKQKFDLPELPQYNRSRHRIDYMKLYNRDLVEIVARRYRKDIEFFGYQDIYRKMLDACP
jgi:hypothetical protein